MKITTIVGRLTRQPVAAKNTDYPRALATCACTVIGHNAQRTTEYVDLIIDGTIGTKMLKHGKKGDLISASGNEHLKTYPKNGGGEGAMNELYVTSFDFHTNEQKADSTR